MQQALRDFAVFSGTLDGLRPAVAQEQAPANAEFVALGMTSKVVVIIENQNSCILAGPLPEKVRGSESADTSPNDDQVVVLSRIFGRAERIRRFSVAQAMGEGKRSIVIAAHPRPCRGVIVRSLFWREFVQRSSRKQLFGRNAATKE